MKRQHSFVLVAAFVAAAGAVYTTHGSGAAQPTRASGTASASSEALTRNTARAEPRVPAKRDARKARVVVEPTPAQQAADAIVERRLEDLHADIERAEANGLGARVDELRARIARLETGRAAIAGVLREFGGRTEAP